MINTSGAQQQVLMENIHPLRLRVLLEIERTGSISAAASNWTIHSIKGLAARRDLPIATPKKETTPYHKSGSWQILVSRHVATSFQ